MPQITSAQANSLVKRGGELLEEAARLTSGVDPNYIRDAQPESIFEAIPLAMARQGCRRYADKGENYPQLRAARAERACRPYLDSLNYNEGPEIELPFRGGQCPAVYLVNFSFGSSLSGPNNGQLRMLGPIGGGRLVPTPNGGRDFEIFASGWAVGFTGCGTVANTGPAWRRIGGMGPAATGYFGRVTSVVPCGVDNCGNLPPEYTPPTTPPTPGPTREPFTIAPGVDIDIELEVNIDGSIDIDIGTGPITIDPFNEPDGGGGSGGGGNDPLPPGFQGEPGAPIDIGPGDAADETDENRNLVGVLVQTIETPARANQVFNQTETYTKGAYFVYFGGDGGLALNPEGAVTRADQFFYAPEGANRFRVVPNVGFTLRVIPFYNEAE